MVVDPRVSIVFISMQLNGVYALIGSLLNWTNRWQLTQKHLCWHLQRLTWPFLTCGNSFVHWGNHFFHGHRFFGSVVSLRVTSTPMKSHSPFYFVACYILPERTARGKSRVDRLSLGAIHQYLWKETKNRWKNGNPLHLNYCWSNFEKLQCG